MSLALGKWDLMLVRNMSSQISLCSPAKQFKHMHYAQMLDRNYVKTRTVIMKMTQTISMANFKPVQDKKLHIDLLNQ